MLHNDSLMRQSFWYGNYLILLDHAFHPTALIASFGSCKLLPISPFVSLLDHLKLQGIINICVLTTLFQTDSFPILDFLKPSFHLLKYMKFVDRLIPRLRNCERAGRVTINEGSNIVSSTQAWQFIACYVTALATPVGGSEKCKLDEGSL